MTNLQEDQILLKQLESKMSRLVAAPRHPLSNETLVQVIMAYSLLTIKCCLSELPHRLEQIEGQLREIDLTLRDTNG